MQNKILNEFLTILVFGAIGGGLVFAFAQGKTNRMLLESCRTLNKKGLHLPRSCVELNLTPKEKTPAAFPNE